MIDAKKISAPADATNADGSMPQEKPASSRSHLSDQFETLREKLADPSDVDARSSVPQRGHATMMGANPGSRAEEESDLDHLGICA